MTILGVLTSLLCALLFFIRWDWAIAILLLSATWTAGSVINFGGSLIIPFELVLACFIIRLAITPEGRKARDFSEKWLLFGAAFILYAIAWCWIGPRIFRGSLTMLPRVGIDGQVEAQSILDFGISNIAQSLYWLAHGLFLGVVVYFGSRLQAKSVINGIAKGSFLFITICIWEIFSSHFGVYFPSSIFIDAGENDFIRQGFMGLERLQSTLPEPSMLGGVMTPVCAFFTLRYMCEAKIHLLICAALSAFVLARSLASTAYLGIIVVLVLAVVSSLTARRQFTSKSLALVMILVLSGFCSLFIVLHYLGYLDDLLFNKLQSGSAFNRGYADMEALRVFRESAGLGFGFGSYRASSLYATVLACGGLLGIAGLIGVTFQCLFNFIQPRGEYPVFILSGCLLSYLMVAGASLPDANAPIGWLLLVLFINALLEPQWRKLPSAGGRLKPSMHDLRNRHSNLQRR